MGVVLPSMGKVYTWFIFFCTSFRIIYLYKIYQTLVVYAHTCLKSHYNSNDGT